MLFPVSHWGPAGLSICGGSQVISGGLRKAVTWNSAGTITQLPALSITQDSGGSQISKDGNTVVGFSYLGSAKAVVWVNGVITNIGALNPSGAARFSYAQFVSDNGLIVCGQGYFSISATRVFRYTGGVFSFITTGSFDVAYDMTPAGTVIVGYQTYDSVGGFTYAFRWDSTSGEVNIDSLSGLNGTSSATGVSSDGTVVTGFYAPNGQFKTMFRWTAAGGMVSIGPGPAVTPSTGNAISADGSTIVGSSQVAGNDNPVYWTSGTGLVNLGLPPGAVSGVATLVSGTGAVIAGYWVDAGAVQHGFVWTSGSGLMDIGSLGGVGTYPQQMSADGTVLVGYSNTASGLRHAFSWTRTGGMVDLGTLPGDTISSASSLSTYFS